MIGKLLSFRSLVKIFLHRHIQRLSSLSNTENILILHRSKFDGFYNFKRSGKRHFIFSLFYKVYYIKNNILKLLYIFIL